MGDIYDPISGVYIQQNSETLETPETTGEIKTYSKKSGTKRRLSYVSDIIKKLKKENDIVKKNDLNRIAHIEIQLSTFEQFDVSNVLKYQIFAFREKLNNYKKNLIRH